MNRMLASPTWTRLLRGTTLALACGCVVWAQSATTLAPNVEATLERAIEAHGGNALEGLRTYTEDATVNATVVGINVYNMRFKTTVDFEGRRGRIEISQDGKVQNIYQVTPQGTWSWSPKTGKKSETPPAKPDAPFTFSTPIKAGVLGLLAVGKVEDEKLTAPDALELSGRRGPAIRREGKGYQVAFVFNKDGLLSVERTVLTNAKGEREEFTLLYDAYRTVNGVRIPVGAALQASQMPGVAVARYTITNVAVNPTLPANAFAEP
jgi:hypothetical protein